MIRCKYCHKWFDVSKKNRPDMTKYCSIKCRRKQNNIFRNIRRQRPKLKKRRCQFCNKWYQPINCDSRFCSIQCIQKYSNTVLRDNIKRRAVDYKGGKCQKCGYNKCLAALEFHHRNPKTKDNLGIGNRHAFSGRIWSKVKRELDKCDLLCANCHRETHHNDKC